MNWSSLETYRAQAGNKDLQQWNMAKMTVTEITLHEGGLG